MTTYRLPEWLGGQVVTILNTEAVHAQELRNVDVKLVGEPDRSWFSVPYLWLTKVEPQLPPEFDDGYVGRDEANNVWQRDDGPENRLPDNSRARSGEHWWRTGDDRPHTWEKVCTKTDPTKWIRLGEDLAETHWLVPKDPPVDFGRSLKLIKVDGVTRVTEKRPIGDLSAVEAWEIASSYLAAAYECNRLNETEREHRV